MKFHFRLVMMFKDEFGSLMGDFRFDNEMF